MNDTIIIRGQTMEICECGECGVVYVVSKLVRDRQRRAGGFSHCPNGHQWGWAAGNTENDYIRQERDCLKQQIAEKDDAIRLEREARASAERSAAAARGQATKLRKRAQAGVCPCCNRTFLSLQRHMTQKHPEFSAENIVPLKAKA